MSISGYTGSSGYSCPNCGAWIDFASNTVHVCHTSPGFFTTGALPTPDPQDRIAAALERIAAALEKQSPA